MFKKVLFLSVAVSVSSLYGAIDNAFEVKPYIGYDSHLGNNRFQKDSLSAYGLSLGARIQPNMLLELGYEKSNGAIYSEGGQFGINRYYANVVNEYPFGIVAPYALAGLGYEHLSEQAQGMNHDIFGQVGVGVRLAMTEWVHLKAEGRYMAVLDGRQDAIASLGVAIPFGKATFSNTAQRSQTSRSAESRQQVAKEDINQQNPQTQSSPTQTAGATTQPSESLEEGTTMAADRQMAKNTEGVDNQPSGVGHSDGSQGATAGVAAGTTAGAVAGERLAYAGIPGQKQVGEGFMMSDGNGGVSSAKNTPVIETEHGKFTPTKTVTLNMNDVRFQFDSFSVPTRFDKDIQEFAGELKQKPSARALLEGHTDYIGTEAYNQKLSVNRANAVKSRLIHFGADRSKIDVKGFGKSRPIADNATDEGRAQNRRVEMILIEPVQ